MYIKVQLDSGLTIPHTLPPGQQKVPVFQHCTNLTMSDADSLSLRPEQSDVVVIFEKNISPVLHFVQRIQVFFSVPKFEVLDLT